MSWPTVKLGDLCEISRGGSPRPIQSYLTDAEDGLNWIKIGDVRVGEKYIASTEEKIKPSGLSATRQVQPGDFLLSNSMSFGRPYISKINGCIHDGWLMLRDTNNHFSQDYLYHMLSSPALKAQFKKFATGAVVKNLNKDVVANVLVPLPPIAQQKRIAAILDKTAEIKARREQAIALFDDIIASVFDSMQLAENFETKCTIKELTKKIRLTPVEDENVWSLSLEHIDANTGGINEIVNVKRNKLGSSTYFFAPPVVLYSKLRPYLNKVALPEREGFATTELVPLYCDESKVLPEYLAAYLRSSKFVEFANTNSAGAKMPRVMMDKFWAHEIKLPNVTKQIQFVEIYKQCKAQKQAHRHAAEILDKLTKSLQHEAFTTGFAS